MYSKKQIEKMDVNNRLFSVVQAFSEIDLSPKTIDNIKMNGKDGRRSRIQ